jgi:hypothetical protein
VHGGQQLALFNAHYDSRCSKFRDTPPAPDRPADQVGTGTPLGDVLPRRSG